MRGYGKNLFLNTETPRTRRIPQRKGLLFNFQQRNRCKPLRTLRGCGKSFFSTRRHGGHGEYHGKMIYFSTSKKETAVNLCVLCAYAVRVFFSTRRHGGHGEYHGEKGCFQLQKQKPL
jgi:hypothetical protein